MNRLLKALLGSWIDITLTLQSSPRPYVDLYRRDRSQGKDRVRDFSATAPGAVWPPARPFFTGSHL